jgi:hypothetical protein
MKKMKHIKLFENFDKLNESENKELIFDWLPFDSQVDNPANSQMATELTYSDLINVMNESTSPKDLGLYIAHQKLSDGFIRVIADLKNPNELIIAKFDGEFKKISEDKVEISEFNLNTYLRGSGIASRFGL